MLNKKIKKGFTLTEIALVLSISAVIGFITFTKMLKQEEFNKAGMAGEQIKLIGDSVNAYISNHYDTLSSLTNATSSSTDLGPRTCSADTDTCTITTQTLVNDGLLPTSYSGTNVYGSDYNIILKRNGVSPYYKINGLITTKTPLSTGSNIRYDLLGQAMQKAGIDSGMTRQSSTVVSGYNGSWNALSKDYENINTSGLLAYQTGYGTYNYSVFLRRDGTLPMTGDLNLGNNNIKNVSDYNGTGNITTGGKIVAGSEISAKNGYGDTITMGGDNAGNDYEIRLGSAKPLTIYSPNATANTNVLVAGGNEQVNGRISTNGLNPNDLPYGWSGGLRTNDVYASGTVGTGSSGNVNAYLNASGEIFANKSINTNGTIYSAGNINTQGQVFSEGGLVTTGNMSASGNITSNQTITASGNINSMGNLYVNGTTLLNGNATLSNGATINNGLTVNGRTTANEYLQINGIATVGNSCSPNGLQGRNSNGQILSCIQGKWSVPMGKISYYEKESDYCYLPNKETGSCSCVSGTTALEVSPGKYDCDTESWGSGNGHSTSCSYSYPPVYLCLPN